MEIEFKKITFLILACIGLPACEKFEAKDFFYPDETTNERFSQSMVWDAKSPYRELDVPLNEYSIYVMADSHVGTTDNLDFFLADAKKGNATAVVMAGDLTNGHPEDYQTFKRHMPPRDSLPLFQIAGNHDYFFNGWKQFYSLFGSTTYLFTVKTPQATDLYICLDSGSGTMGSSQLKWLENTLESERAKYRDCIIFTHVNLFRIRHTVSTNPYVEELQVLLELCIKYQINMVVAGHDHERNAARLGNTTHLTLDALQDGLPNSGYLILGVKEGTIDYKFINF